MVVHRPSVRPVRFQASPLGRHPSRVANHLGAAVAIVDVGADLDHARQARVVGRGQLFSAGAPQAADDGDLDLGSGC